MFPSPDSRFHFGTLIISIGLLPGHAAVLSNTPQVAIALGRCGFSLAAGDRRDARRHNHFGFGMTVSDRSIDTILIVGSVRVKDDSEPAAWSSNGLDPVVDLFAGQR